MMSVKPSTGGTIVMLAVMTAAWAVPSFAVESQPAIMTHIALLEAEYVTADAKVARHELTGWLDTVLTESLSRQKGFALVDRQALDKVLAEKNLEKLDVKSADVKLKPFVTSGVFVCPMIVADAKSRKATVTIQAVLAQRGTLLAEIAVAGDVVGDGWKADPKLDRPLEQFWQDVREQIETNLGLPCLEIRRIGLKSRLDRLQWMADDLTDSLTTAPHEGLALLVPRQPVHTKEERLLRLMGLASPSDGDKSAKLAAASDFQLWGELAEDAEPGIVFEQTSIKLSLRLDGGGRQFARTELEGTAGEYPKVRRQALEWAAKELSKAAKVKIEPPDESYAKALAQQEVAVARRLMAVSYGSGAMDRDRQERLALAALRAAHLDPTSEEAAYLVIQSIDGLYDCCGQRDSLACWDRLLAETGKYLDRFGDRVPEHHCRVLDRISDAGFRAMGILRPQRVLTEDILSEPREQYWLYVRAYVLADMEMGVRGVSQKVYDRSNALQSMPGHIRLHLIPSIPADRLDDEYGFWREFWRKRVEPLGDDQCIPWDCIEMAFAARRKDVDGVRAAAQRLAAKYPKSRKDIWNLLLNDTVSLYLRAAGDKEWQTWQPTFAKPNTPRTDAGVGLAFYNTWRPPMPTAWDYGKATTLPAVRITFPNNIAKAGGQNYVTPYPKMECFLVAGGDAWLVSPCLWDNRNRPHRLLVAPAKPLIGKESIEASLAEVQWPAGSDNGTASKPADSSLPFVTCWAVTANSDGDDTVWMGTRDRGLARFEKKDGRWVGRWYASRQGMPSESICNILTFGNADRRKLLLVGGGPRDKAGTKMYVWTLDVQSGQVKLLAEVPTAYSMGTLTAVWSDGRKLPLSASSEYGCEGLDPEAIREVITTGPALPDWPVEGIDLWFMRGEGALRLWQVGKGRRSSINEVSPLSLDALARPGIRGPVTVADSGSVPAPCRFSGLVWHDLSEGLPTHGPLDKVCSSLVVGENIWLVVRPYEHAQHRSEGFYIMLYHPAPQDEKNWASHDRWIGPFKLAVSSPIFRLTGDSCGGVWVTGADAIYRVDVKAMLAQPGKGDNSLSTERWGQDFEKRLSQADSAVRLRVLLARKQFKPALELVGTRLTEMSDAASQADQAGKTAWTQAMLHKALVLGCMERWDDSLSAYAKVRELGVEPGRSFASREAMWVLATAKRWPEFLKEVEAQDLKLVDGDVLTTYVKQARQEVDRESRQPGAQTAPSPP